MRTLTSDHTDVARVRIPEAMANLDWGCCSFSPLFRKVILRILLVSPLLNTKNSKFQFIRIMDGKPNYFNLVYPVDKQLWYRRHELIILSTGWEACYGLGLLLGLLELRANKQNVASYQDVFQLEVSVNNPQSMNVCQSIGDLFGPLRNVFDGFMSSWFPRNQFLVIKDVVLQVSLAPF